MGKKKYKKKKKKNKIILIIFGVIVVFLILFKVVIYSDNYSPRSSCNVAVDRFTHVYFGIVTNHCGYLNCHDDTNFVVGRLKVSEYKGLKEDLTNSFDVSNKIICSLFTD